MFRHPPICPLKKVNEFLLKICSVIFSASVSTPTKSMIRLTAARCAAGEPPPGRADKLFEGHVAHVGVTQQPERVRESVRAGERGVGEGKV